METPMSAPGMRPMGTWIDLKRQRGIGQHVCLLAKI
jgi:hypothetical protein